jgi:hypothetical protein
MATEIAGGNGSQVGLNVDIGRLERGQRAGDILFGQNIDHLRRNGQQGAHAFGGKQRRTDVDRDDDVGIAAFPGFADRHVIDQAAVDQLSPFAGDRRQQSRHRHAGAHGRGQAAFAHDHALAGADVGGDERQRQRQLLDAPFAPVGADQLVEEELDLDAVDHAGRKAGAVARNTELGAGDEPAQRPLVAVIGLGKIGDVAEHRVPVRLGHLGTHHRRCQARGIGAGDQRPHAGAGDAVDRNLQFLKNFQHPDVRGPTGAAAAEDQAEAWRILRRQEDGGGVWPPF